MTPEQVYEATRGVWKLGEDRDKAEYALSLADGVVREVYAIGSWHQAGSTKYQTRPYQQVAVPSRWEFLGKVAPAAVRDKYIGKSLAHYFPKGSSNPVLYVNIK